MIRLKRAVGLTGLTLYGLGVTLGAGIYALIGEMSGAAGLYAPLAFLFAGGLAAFTGLSYAELASRYPEAAGEAAYVDHAFSRRAITALAGYGVVLSGSISAAVVLHGFAGYFSALSALPSWIAVFAVIAGLVAIVAWGVELSIWVAGAITVTEAAGLLMIIAVATPDAVTMPPPAPDAVGIPWAGIFAATVMAFFAFIGFEDIVNMAEETRAARRTVPLAILLTLSISAVLYAAVSFVAVRAVDPAQLAEESGPLAAVFESATGLSGTPIALIAVLAMLNGALVQLMMASRVFYGLARRGLAPAPLARVHRVRRTPVRATLLAGTLVAALTLAGGLGPLAIAASTVTLLVFSLVNAALIAVRWRDPECGKAGFQAPVWAPYLGVATSLAAVAGVAVQTFS
ncbi:APC family permease [Hyphobacterium sp.]|uniref:APC family permease n=1 Tax=Hyphobacterium sp. TaxID=2004662 RepID=UPI003BABCC71